MHRRFLSLVVLGAILVIAGSSFAGIHEGYDFVDRLDEARKTGTLSADEALLYKFYYVFDHDKLPADIRPDSFPPLKCATPMIQEFEQSRGSLSEDTIAAVEAMLAPRGGDKALYISPSGIFRFSYATTGGDAVPTADTTPANGIPDFVEWCAGYLDYSWDFEITTMGFTAPPLSPYYEINFESMGAYGYTQVVSGTRTRITLHNTFLGFPANDDPEGNQKGAAKVTCAHEFKHASQRAQSSWTEGGWVEVDATWMEDIAYDQVNDFYNYLFSGNGITSPELSLDDGGSGSYEDCIWQHWMSETYGNQIMIDFWAFRSTHTAWTVLSSYNAVLATYGSSLSEGYGFFSGWNSACGARALAGIGYGEAADFSTSSQSVCLSYPYNSNGTLNHLAAKYIYAAGFTNGEPGLTHVEFNGDDGTAMSLIAVIRKRVGAAVFEPITLDANHDADTYLSVPCGEIYSVYFVIANTAQTGTNRTWALTLSKDIPPEPMVDLSSGTLALALDIGDNGTQDLTITNVGDAASALSYDVILSDVSNPLVSAYAPLTWLSVDIDNGDLGYGEDDLLTFTFDATGLAEDVYTGYVVITSNAASSPDVVTVTFTVTDPGTAVGDSPDVFALKGNYPNPFNPSTQVSFVISEAGPITVDVIDLQGRVVRTLHSGHLEAGPTSMAWDGTDADGRMMASGTYMARLRAAGRTATHKMTLAK